MASKILTCSYGPNTASLTRLQDRQVSLLNRNGTQDISQRVGRLVSKHLNYQGKERFEAEVTKTKITFHLLSDPSQTRVLEYRSNKWQLTTSGTTTLSSTAELDDAVQAEVTGVIEEVLNKISNASKATFDDDAPASHCTGEPLHATLPLAAEPYSSPLGERLTRVEERLARLEEALLRRSATSGHDSSIASQLAAIQTELRYLSDEVRHLHGLATKDSTVEVQKRMIEALESRLTQTQREPKKILATEQKHHEAAMLKAQGEIQRLKGALRSLEERFSELTPKIKANTAELKALREKDAQAAQTLQAKENAHAAQIRELEIQLTASKTALETSQRENEEARTVAKTEIAALQEQMAKLREENTTAQQKVQRVNEDLQRQLAAAEGKYVRLEESQTAALAERTKLAQEGDLLRAQLKTVLKEKAELEARLKALEESAQTSQAGLSQQNNELKDQLKARTESLEATQVQLAANQALSQNQTERLKTLEAELAAEKASVAQMQKEKEQHAEQIAKLTAEKEGQLAQQLERMRKLIEEKLSTERNLAASGATIEKQFQELEALKKRLEEMRAEKARQVSAAYTRTTHVTEETARTETEVTALLQRFAHATKANSSMSSTNIAGSGSKV